MLKQPFDLVGCVVLTASREGIGGATVMIRDVSRKPVVTIGNAVTDAQGIFRLAVDSSQFDVQACGDCAAPPPLAFDVETATKYFPQQEREVLWKVVPRLPSQFETVAAGILPRLGTTPITDITPCEAKKLSDGSGVPVERVQRYLDATRFASMTGVPAEVFYGLLREGIPQTLNELLAMNEAAIRTALMTAADRQVVGQALRSTVDVVIAQLRGASVRRALQLPGGTNPTTLGRVFATAVASSEDRETLLTLMKGHEGAPEQFWQILGQMPDFQGKIADIQAALQFATLTGMHAPLVEALQQRRVAGTVTSLQQLASYGESQWVAVLQGTVTPNGPVVGAPSRVQGATEQERYANYALELMATLEVAFPTTFVGARLAEEADFAGKDDMVKFFANNAEFDLLESSYEQFVAEKGEAAFGEIAPENKATLKNNVEKFQRLYKVADNYKDTRDLDALGYPSAVGISSQLAETFVAQASGTFGEERAYDLYNQASMITATTTTLYGMYGADMGRALPAVVPSRPEGVDGVPDYTALFGSQDYCACEHCRSILGPAAYLVDLLEFLRHEPANGGVTAQVRFFERRPDVARIKLTCENTNKRVPYVDLLNEVLERAVRRDSDPAHPTLASLITADISSDGTEEDLAAVPQYLAREAYTVLRDAPYPFSLPFSLDHAEARAYLDAQGFTRRQVMELLRNLGEGTASADLALEQLRLTKRDRELLVTPETARHLWGLDAGAPLAVLSQASQLMTRGALTLDEIFAVVDSQFVRGTGGAVTVTINGDDECDPRQITFNGLTEERLQRMAGLLRLRSALGWMFVEVDQALGMLGGLDGGTLERLTTVHRIAQGLALTPPQVLSFWLDLDAVKTGPDSSSTLYRDVFQNRVLRDPARTDEYAYFATLPPADPPANSIAAHASYIAAALAIPEGDVRSLATALGETAVTQASLSRLHRRALLSRALRLTVRELLLLEGLSGQSAFDDAPEASVTSDREAHVEALVTTARRITASGFDLDAVDYLLHDDRSQGGDLRLGDRALGDLIAALHEAFGRIVAENPVDDEDHEGGRARELLETKLTAADADLAMRLLREPTDETLPGGAAGVFDSMLAPLFVDAADARSKLATTPLPSAPARYLYTARALVVAERGARAKEALVDEFVSRFGLSVQATRLVLRDLPVTTFGADARLEGVFLREDFALLGVEAPAAPVGNDQARAALLFHKVGMLVGLLRVPADRLAFVLAPPPGGLSLDDLVAGTAVAPTFVPARLAKLLRTAECVRLSARLPEFASMIGTAASASTTTPAAIVQAVGPAFGWKPADVMEYATLAALFAAPAAEERIAWVARVVACVEALAQLGVPLEDLLRLAHETDAPPDQFAAAVASLKAATHARFGGSTWPQVARRINDTLRESRRVALVAWLTHNGDHPDTNRLYGRYLIDPEMCTCASTSRVQQALGAVQLFMQRALMNLEPDYKPTPEARRRWEWMSRYRIWEANRKIFLYPENWLEPDLRDDKTPFFEELESELNQADVTPEIAERALGRYIERLHEVSKLEVCALYRDPDGDVVHIFARTAAIPQEYYYREWINASHFTAWQKVDVAIDGGPLTPVKYNNRLYLFWLERSEKTSYHPPPPGAAGSGDNGTNVPSMALKVAWTAFFDGRWQTKRISPEMALPPTVRALSEQSFLRASPAARDGVQLEVVSLTHDSASIVVRFSLLDPTSAFRNGGAREENVSRLLFVPYGMLRDGNHLMCMQGAGLDGAIYVPTVTPGHGNPTDAELASVRGTPGTLALPPPHAPETYRLTPPCNYDYFYMQDAFTVEEADRAYFAVPSLNNSYEWQLAGSSWIGRTPPRTPRAGGTSGEVRDLTPLGRGAGSAMDAFLLSGGGADSTFFVDSFRFEEGEDEQDPPPPDNGRVVRFMNLSHPHSNEFTYRFSSGGAQGLFTWYPASDDVPAQFLQADDFNIRYNIATPPCEALARPLPQADVAFNHHEAYAQYNWELFFHVPFLIATRLSASQRFADAQRWFHYLFDPTDANTRAGLAPFWRSRPLAEHTSPRSAEFLLRLLDTTGGSEEVRASRVEFLHQIEQWRADPFNPHLIARLRVSPYQKAVVMRYVDNLVAWGDQRFREDTMESVQEAAQFYVLAAELLGPRPAGARPNSTPVAMTYASFLSVDTFSNTLARIESRLPVRRGTPGPSGPPGEALLPTLTAPQYFCVPMNETLLGHWDTVADRLYKLRHCMNLDGVERQLDLFAPPIDPALLVRARAAGVDVRDALSSTAMRVPNYRLAPLLQRAQEFCADVRALGAALLSTLEKRDAEGLSLLRTAQERKMLEAARAVRTKQIDEARQSIQVIERNISAAQARYDFYSGRERVSQRENDSLTLSMEGAQFSDAGQLMKMMAGAMHAIPDFIATASITPGVSTEIGGSHIGSMYSAMGEVYAYLGSIKQFESSRTGVLAGYDRRAEDWDHLAQQAQAEVRSLDAQKVAAEIRLAVAEQEFENHERQIANAREIEEYLNTKFSSEELYRWMADRTAQLYFGSYRIALDLAHRAERAFQFEHGDEGATFVTNNHWDGLRKGLMAGERLHAELRRMELAQIDRNRRDYEITKHLSLAMLDPRALEELKRNGHCEIELQESVFDRDYPGHYFRRIKSVSVSIPCVTGAYSGVHAKLTLLKSWVRKSVSLRSGATAEERYPREEGTGGDVRFVEFRSATESIITSSGQADSGVFQLDLRDERYLPFEGAGAISTWKLELSQGCNDFDVRTVTDVVMHMQYTAREGTAALRADASALVSPPSGMRAFSVRNDMPDAWHQFRTATGAARSVALGRIGERLGFLPPGRALSIDGMWVFAVGPQTPVTGSVSLSAGAAPSAPVALASSLPVGDRVMSLTGCVGAEIAPMPGLPVGTTDVRAAAFSLEVAITVPPTGVDTLDDLVVFVSFTRSPT